MSAPSTSVHALFYANFGARATDGAHLDWELPTQPRPKTNDLPKARHAPDSVATTFCPSRGLYSSGDPKVLAAQFRELRRAGVGVAVVPFPGRPGATRASYERLDPEAQERPLEVALDAAFEAAAAAGVKITFLIDNYRERHAQNVRADISYILGKYGAREAFFRDATRGGRGWVYVHDATRMSKVELGSIFTPAGRSSIRGTPSDVVVLALVRNDADREHLLASGFDGIFTHYAADGFTDAARTSAWPALSAWAHSHGKTEHHLLPLVPRGNASPHRSW